MWIGRYYYAQCNEEFSPEEFRTSLTAMNAWLRENRNRRLRWLGEHLSAKLRGYWNYYGVIGNSQRLKVYWQHAKRLVYKWLNRRSQRRSYNWTSFEAMWQTMGLPAPRIVERPYLPQLTLPLP